MLYIEEEQRYKRLKKLAQELHIPTPEAFLTLEVFDREGKLIQKHRQRSHSWTRNAYNMMFSQMAGKDASDATFEAGKLSAKNSAGTIKNGAFPMGQYHSGSVDGTTYGFRAGAGIDIQGILVGSGVDAESFESYFLATQLDEGTGAGQISHVASEAHSIAWNGGTRVLKNDLIRYFNNNSAPAGDRTVNEVALVGTIYVANSGNQIMVSRDKLASPVTVPNTGQLKVTYTIQLTYPT